MTTSPAHPVQLLLDGQAAAPDGPVDLAAMYVMHRGFRRDGDAFARAAAVTPVSDRARWARLSRRFALFAGILHKHHHGEDIGLWPLLRERGADPEVLDALQAEHARIDPLLASCSGDLAALARGAGEETRRRLAGCTAELRDLLSAHLGHEERDGMALVQRHLSPADWRRLDREVFAKEYRPREIPAVLAWVMSGLPAEAARRMPGGSNPAFLAVGRLLARRFDRAEARTFGSA